MNVLILNCGSSSIKFQIAVMPQYDVLIEGGVERVGYEDAIFSYKICNSSSVKKQVTRINNHEEGISLILDTIFKDSDTGMSLSSINAVGHRVVQGGSRHNISVPITTEVTDYIESIKDLAPLHNPNHLAGIYACQKLLKDVPQVAVFDNGFHMTVPKSAYTYGLPHDLCKKYGVRKYGFHGIAFRSMAEEAEKLLEAPYKEFKIVNMMLGSGTTANALKYGESVEVSTGFTPQEGLIQSTRAGDLDTAAVLYIMDKEGLSIEQGVDLINKKSGWKGMSGLSNDMRDIYNAANSGNELAQLTIDTVCHRFKKYIGAYSAIMEGVDILVFSGGLGQNAWYIREKVCAGLDFMGISLDKDKNKELKGSGFINTKDSKVKILVVKVNEEKIIAEDTYSILK
ncbi:MAG: acetate/propionate family kinase [Clostridiaceae bacterium]